MYTADRTYASVHRSSGALNIRLTLICMVGACLALAACGGRVGLVAQTPAAPLAAPDACHSSGITYCALNPAVSQSTIRQTICVSGWTATIRPPASYTDNLKRQQISQERLPGGLRDYEEDHRMPLGLGGAPSDVMNLSPEAPPSPNAKDDDETRLRTAVCDGALTLMEAQHELVAAWLAPYPQYKQ